MASLEEVYTRGGGVNFDSLGPILLAVGSLCFVLMVMVKDMFVVKNPLLQPPCLPTAGPPCPDGDGALSPNKPFLL